ncbi:MAG: 50S ribosomal protein L9 [Candidatus Pacebacteria bacterium]|nr:50S ribosomal protein L9 [Candidatus Paceibacterota bacterium]
MKIILLKDAKNIGKKYDIKDVSDGHALNHLIPQGIGEVATPGSLKKVEVLKMRDVEDKKIQENLLEKNLKAVGALKIVIKEKANEKGHLFAQIHKEEIAKAVKAQSQIDILPDFITLEKPIKEVGEHKIEVKAGQKNTVFALSVEPA